MATLPISNSSNVVVEYYAIGWLLLPLKPDSSWDIIGTVNEVTTIAIFIFNPLLLWMIARNPGKNQRSNIAMLLANLAVVNLVAGLVGVLTMIDHYHGTEIMSHKVTTIILSILLPMYYPSIFVFTLTYYKMIVEPLEFKTLDPRKVKTVKIIIASLWVVTTTIFLITPFLVEDFGFYVRVLITCVVVACWIATIMISYMFLCILYTLYKRNRRLKTKFNASRTRQGALVILQNIRLAKVLFLYMIVLVITTLPLFTAYLFILHSPGCSNDTLAKFCLYTLPLFLAKPASHAVHWLLGTPQYWKELKSLSRKMLVMCGCLEKKRQGTQDTFALSYTNSESQNTAQNNRQPSNEASSSK